MPIDYHTTSADYAGILHMFDEPGVYLFVEGRDCRHVDVLHTEIDAYVRRYRQHWVRCTRDGRALIVDTRNPALSPTAVEAS
jgi:hypothetical protein